MRSISYLESIFNTFLFDWKIPYYIYNITKWNWTIQESVKFSSSLVVLLHQSCSGIVQVATRGFGEAVRRQRSFHSPLWMIIGSLTHRENDCNSNVLLPQMEWNDAGASSAWSRLPQNVERRRHLLPCETYRSAPRPSARSRKKMRWRWRKRRRRKEDKCVENLAMEAPETNKWVATYLSLVLVSRCS